MARAVSELENHLGYWLRAVSNQVSQAFSRKVEARGVTVAEWVVLRMLFDRAALAPSDLAAKIGMTRGAISKLAERLIAKELVTRRHDANDRRYQELALTSEGRALVPALAALADQNDHEFFGHLAPKQRADLENLMRMLVQRLELRAVPTQ